MSHTHQLTIRGLDQRLFRQIKELSEREGISLNKAALRLMGQAAGGQETGHKTIGSSLDDLIGTWSDEQAEDFMDSIATLTQIDRELWG